MLQIHAIAFGHYYPTYNHLANYIIRKQPKLFLFLILFGEEDSAIVISLVIQ